MRALQRVLEHEREIPLLFTTLCMLEIERRWRRRGDDCWPDIRRRS